MKTNTRFIYYAQRDEFFAFDVKTRQSIAITDSASRNQILSKCNVVSYPNEPLEHVTFTPTGRCNLLCSHCYIGGSHPKSLSITSILHMLDELAQMGTLTITITGGESLLYPELTQVLERATELGLSILLKTNGYLLNKKITPDWAKYNFNCVSISLDGSNPTTHDWLRGINGSFESTIAGIKTLSEMGIHVDVTTVLHKRVLPELTAMAKLMETLNINQWWLLDMISMGIALEHLDELMPTPLELVENLKSFRDWLKSENYQIPILSYPLQAITNREAVYSLNRTNPFYCAYKQNYVYISSDGTVTPCVRKEVTYGNINETSIREIWEQRNNIVDTQLTSNTDPCENCPSNVICNYFRYRCPAMPCDAYRKELMMLLDNESKKHSP